MTRPVHDLVVTAADGTKYGYYVYVAAESPLEIDLAKPDIAANVITEAPGKQGGYYSVRDQDQPAIVYSDWSQGAGQKSYEVEDSYSSKFHSSSYIDTQMKGELRLARSVTLDTDSDAEGVIISALGTVFMGFTPASADPRNTIRYWNGTAWVAVPFDGTDPATGVSCFATDGQYLYAALGGTDGVWRVQDSDGDGAFDDETLTNWASGADADGIQAMVYSGGYMYAAKADSVGYFDATPTWQQTSPAVLEATTSTFGLAAASNWVYWGSTKEGVTRVDRTQYDGTYEWYEAVCDFPSGFVGTCMVGYLNEVYVGGYYECATSSTGQGAIYKIIDGTPHLLTVIGDNPDYTSDPSSIDNDNRVWAVTPAGKDLFILTTRRVLRWDLDDGGWVHVCDVPQGTVSLFTWNVNYNCGALPDASWTKTGTGTAQIFGSARLLLYAPTPDEYIFYQNVLTGDNALSTTVGTTMEVVIPAFTEADTGYRNPVWGAAGLFGFYDGTNMAAVWLWNKNKTATLYRVALGEYVAGAWNLDTSYLFGNDTAHTLRLTCKGGVASLYADGILLRSVSHLLSVSGMDSYVHIQGGYYDPDVSGASWLKLDNVAITNDGAYPPGTEYSASSVGGVAVRDSKLYVGINSIGNAVTGTTYKTEGWLRQSESASKSGSMEKRYHRLVVTHEPLRDGEDIACEWYIDGNYGAAAGGTTVGTTTTFDIDETGHNISPIVVLRSDGDTTPVVKSVMVTFEFTKPTVHTYTLDCRRGVEGGRWGYDPESAIRHLYTVAQQGGSFESQYAAYDGMVQSLRVLQAQRSTRGGIEGIVELKVRQI